MREKSCRFQGKLGNIWLAHLASFVRAVLIEQSWIHGRSTLGSTTRDAGEPGSNPALGEQWSRDYPIDVPAPQTIPNSNFRYQKLLTGAKGTE